MTKKTGDLDQQSKHNETNWITGHNSSKLMSNCFNQIINLDCKGNNHSNFNLLMWNTFGVK